MPDASSLLATHLHLLVCPVCHASLQLDPNKIHCTGCRRDYPIIDGLPVLIASRATNASPPADESAS